MNRKEKPAAGGENVAEEKKELAEEREELQLEKREISETKIKMEENLSSPEREEDAAAEDHRFEETKGQTR